MTIADEIKACGHTSPFITAEQAIYNKGIKDAARIAEAGEAKLREALGKCTGMFAAAGFCEPVEGFAARPQDLEGCITEMAGCLDVKTHRLESLRVKLTRAREVIEAVIRPAELFATNWQDANTRDALAGALVTARAFLKEIP